jgi:hypothetical protein
VKAGEEPVPAECVGGVLVGGDTGEAAAGNGLFLLVRPPFGGGERGAGAAGGGVQASCWVLREQALLALFLLVPAPAGHQTAGLFWWDCGPLWGVGVWWRFGWWGWSLFENCTVDASIFVVKLPRADGECLGTRSR